MNEPVPATRTRSLRAALAGATLLLALFTFINLDLPLVRNGITYARTAQAIVDANFDVLAVNADSRLLFGRPVGFPMVSSPFVALIGANSGLKIASFASTLLFLWVSCAFISRQRRQLALDSAVTWLDVALLAFNPLVVYQAWSAHPDALFSATFLLSLMLTDRIVTAAGWRTAALAVALCGAIYASIELKYYGAILIAICPVYAAIKLRFSVSRLAPVVAAAAVPLLLVIAGFMGRNETLNLGSVSGMDRYEDALTDAGTFTLYGFASVVQIAIFLMIVLGPVAIYLFRVPPRSRAVLALWAVSGIFVLGLLPFRGTGYNMRYFLPLLPIIVVAARESMRVSAPARRRVFIGLFVVLQSMAILNFNARPVYEALSPVNSVLESIHYPGTRRVMAVFDSLRMGHHVASQQVVEFIANEMRPGETLVFVTDYYRAASHRYFEDEGLVDRTDINIRYSASLAEARKDQPPGPYLICVRCDEVLIAPGPAAVEATLGRRVSPAGRVMRVE